MSPRLFAEKDLVPVPGVRGAEGAPPLVQRFLAAPTSRHLHRRVHEAVRAAGFQWMTHASAPAGHGLPAITRVFASHAHPAWLSAYFGERLDQIDPRLAPALSSNLPFVWALEDERLRPGRDDGAARFARRLRAMGIGSGVLVAVPPGYGANERALVCLSSGRTGRHWIDDVVIGRSLMFALCLHELLATHRSLADACQRSIVVSPTRQEILRQVAQGQSNKQIAYQLELSTDTIKYHLGELMRHFKVRNRMQLVSSVMHGSVAASAPRPAGP
ncbi:MAG TPA: LuxR C-terminal-related transcriptional regulator [Albitalea sp.]|uniref:helix-turn-helix transcriptional regulator n=1 Tax=Piscinibacter sp. TaxID=1903157 RepID=UPI002ED1072A